MTDLRPAESRTPKASGVREQLVKIADLHLDTKLYPRLKTSWFTAYSYAQNMRAGAVFPPVIVGRLKGKLYLVDGWHRVAALKLLKEEHVKAKVKTYENKQDLFLDAIRLNTAHGKQLSMQERVSIIHRLQKMHFALDQISEIVRIPSDKIKLFTARIIRGPSGEVIYLKALTMKATKGELEKADAIDQTRFSVRYVEDLLIQLTELLEHDILPDTPRVKELAAHLYALLSDKLQLVKVS